MKPNEIKQILAEISDEMGWNEESQIHHLCNFLYYSNHRHVASAEQMAIDFRVYLRNKAEEEKAYSDATCEHCGAACDYDSELCLCKKCEAHCISARMAVDDGKFHDS